MWELLAPAAEGGEEEREELAKLDSCLASSPSHKFDVYVCVCIFSFAIGQC